LALRLKAPRGTSHQAQYAIEGSYVVAAKHRTIMQVH
jgi:hypothetical protein